VARLQEGLRPSARLQVRLVSLLLLLLLLLII